MENTQTQKIILKILFGFTAIYAILMFVSVLWTLYGPIPGMRFKAVVDLDGDGKEPGIYLRYNRYFLSPYISRAYLIQPVVNLPPELAQAERQVTCTYKIALGNNDDKRALDGSGCVASDLTEFNNLISSDIAITHVRSLPEVREFIVAVEKQSSNRRVSYRIDESTNIEYYTVIVAETDDTKETIWKRFLVNKKSAQILVEDPLTGEFELYK